MDPKKFDPKLTRILHLNINVCFRLVPFRANNIWLFLPDLSIRVLLHLLSSKSLLQIWTWAEPKSESLILPNHIIQNRQTGTGMINCHLLINVLIDLMLAHYFCPKMWRECVWSARFLPPASLTGLRRLEVKRAVAASFTCTAVNNLHITHPKHSLRVGLFSVEN